MKSRRFFIEDEELLNLYVEQELTSRAIAARYGVHVGTVLHRLRKMGVDLRGRKKAMPESFVIGKLYSEGLSCQTIGKRVGCSPAYARNAIVRLGLQLRRCGSKSSERCKVEGCISPAAKFNRGKWICGSMCVQHRREYTAKMARETHRTSKELPIEKWRRPQDIPDDNPKKEDLVCLRQLSRTIKQMQKMLRTARPTSVQERLPQKTASTAASTVRNSANKESEGSRP